MEPLPTEGGYFLIVDISKCINMIPKIYLTTHDFEEGDPSTFVGKNYIYM